MLLAVLVGLTGGVVLTATAGARRTDSAYGRFLAASRAADLLVSPNNTGFGGYYRALAKLPGAETVAPVIGIQALPVLPGQKLVEAQVYAPADRRLARAIERPRILEGRLPNPARVHEVALDARAAQKLHAASAARSRWRQSSRRLPVNPNRACGSSTRRWSVCS
jgi:hypothetical protein